VGVRTGLPRHVSIEVGSSVCVNSLDCLGRSKVLDDDPTIVNDCLNDFVHF
jgi:hypothetical protein